MTFHSEALPRHRGGHDCVGRELRDASVVTLKGCKQEMVVKHLIGDKALCVWLDMNMQANEFAFPEIQLERISW